MCPHSIYEYHYIINVQSNTTKVTSSFTKRLLSLVREDENCKEAAPLLFGPDFAKKSKEYTDHIKAMRSSNTRPESKKPFLKYPPPCWLVEATAKDLRDAETPTSGDVVADAAHSLSENITRVKVPTEQRKNLHCKCICILYQKHSEHIFQIRKVKNTILIL